MRILYHHRTLADGAEGIHIKEMVEAFRGLGHEVRVLGPAASVSHGRRGSAARLKARIPKAVLELGFLAYDLRERATMRRALEEFRPDFVYKRHAKYDVACAHVAAQAGVPLVLEVNCLFSVPPYSRFEPLAFGPLAKWRERQSLRAAISVVAVSTPLARQVEQLAGVRAVALPNGANLAQFDPNRVAPVSLALHQSPRDAFVVGWSGILREWHGLDILLGAIQGIPAAHLMIVGDGPARAAVEAQAARLGVADRLTITGRVPHDEVPRYVAAMDVCVVADERTGIASPMKLVEYMAMGRPVVAPRLENIEDVVTHETDGLLFDQGSAASLGDALKRLAMDAALRSSLGGAARAKVLSTLNWRANAASVVGLVMPDEPA